MCLNRKSIDFISPTKLAPSKLDFFNSVLLSLALSRLAPSRLTPTRLAPLRLTPSRLASSKSAPSRLVSKKQANLARKPKRFEKLRSKNDPR